MRPTALTRSVRRAAATVAVALATVAMAGCAANPQEPDRPLTAVEREALLQERIAELEPVASVEIGGMEPRDENPRYTTVTIETDAAPKAVLSASDAIVLLADDLEWEDPITLRADPPAGATGDAPSADPWWSLEVHPSEDAAVTRAALAGLVTAAQVDGVVGLSFVEGWPYAALTEPDRAAARFAELRRTPLFEHGGTFTVRASQPWLKFTWVEGTTSVALVEELVAISSEFPHAEVLLDGPEAPAVRIARVGAAEAEAIAARLADPALIEGVDDEAVSVPWQVSTTDGAVLEGEVGRG